MSFNMDDVNIGGQLHIGRGVYPAIKEGRNKINGSAGIEGPVVIGKPTAFTETKATLMLAECNNNDKDCSVPKTTYGVSGKQPEVLQTKGNFYHDGDIYVTGSIDCISVGRLEARHSRADALPKCFDMPHPTHGEGHRLAHACIEGPEVAVYCRGRCRNSKEIYLPSYWKDLVHINSITVQLQPIGAHQDVIVKRWDDEFIHLQGKGIPIDCFYHVYAERKDCNPLVVEYEGNTDKDYPDPDYNDPKYRGQNTITG